MHLRNSLAVPAHLSRLGGARAMVSIAPWEVAAHITQVPDTEDFDYVWFTGIAEREDPCERFARHMQSGDRTDRNRGAERSP